MFFGAGAGIGATTLCVLCYTDYFFSLAQSRFIFLIRYHLMVRHFPPFNRSFVGVCALVSHQFILEIFCFLLSIRFDLKISRSNHMFILHSCSMFTENTHTDTHTVWFERHTFFALLWLLSFPDSKLKSSIYYHWHPTGQFVCNMCVCVFVYVLY